VNRIAELVRSSGVQHPRCWALILLVAGCGAQNNAPTEPARAGSYEVHEWGLVRALPGDSLSAGAIAPPLRVEPIAVDKPVLYFHAEAPLRLSAVRVDAQGGSLVEAWPLATLGASIAWRDIEIDPGAQCQPSPLPSASDPACAHAPGQCEIPSLGTVRATDAACLRTAGATDSLLFYRAVSRAFTPPLRYTLRPDRQVEVTNEGDLPIPGRLVRMRRFGSYVQTLAVAPPAPHQSILVGENFGTTVDDIPPADETPPSSPDVGRRAVRATMHDIGLTDPEIDAFLRAWDATLFGGGDTDCRGCDTDRVDRPAAPENSFLYFLPEAACARIATLDLDPQPRTVHRAMAVWSPLPASGSSH
jgi:hypothetical protein